MRLYYTGASPDNLRKARKHAPSHSHGFGWTPEKMTTGHDYPYFLDNGAYSDDFESEPFLSMLEDMKGMWKRPDFVVLPDVYGDAEATFELHEDAMEHRRDEDPRWRILHRGDVTRYAVLQPGLPIAEQFDRIPGLCVDGVFVGGPKRWKRAYGAEIVAEADERGLSTHVGNPSGDDGLVWAYRCGFDSADTTTVFQNGYWHYLEALEAATEETSAPAPARDSAQLDLVESTVAADGGEEGGA